MVGNVVKNLVDFVGVTDGNFDRVRVFQAVQVERRGRHVGDELGPDLEFWKQVVNAQRLNEGGVAFVEPQMSPPFLPE